MFCDGETRSLWLLEIFPFPQNSIGYAFILTRTPESVMLLRHVQNKHDIKNVLASS